MEDLAPIDPKLLALLRSLDQQQVPQPFGREIFIISTYIAGTAYYKAGEVGDMLKEGSHLILRRESNNPYDDKAIAILDLDQNKLGYLPQRKNEIISRLMDAGKAIYAVVENKQKNGDYLQIGIKVYMREY